MTQNGLNHKQRLFVEKFKAECLDDIKKTIMEQEDKLDDVWSTLEYSECMSFVDRLNAWYDNEIDLNE